MYTAELPTEMPTTAPTSTPTISPTSNPTALYFDIEMYSRGFDNTQVNNWYYSFIKVNGVNILAEYGGIRGSSAVVLDPVDGSVIDKLWLDTYYDTSLHENMANFLTSTRRGDIILFVIFDTAIKHDMSSFPSNIKDVLQSYGCDIVTTVAFREPFVFVGSNNAGNPPSWTHCEKSGQYGPAIYRTFELEAEVPTAMPTYAPAQVFTQVDCVTVESSAWDVSGEKRVKCSDAGAQYSNYVMTGCGFWSGWRHTATSSIVGSGSAERECVASVENAATGKTMAIAQCCDISAYFSCDTVEDKGGISATAVCQDGPSLTLDEFGFKTHTISYAGTSGTVKLYLWFDNKIYSCSFNPTSADTEYSCNDNSWTDLGYRCNNDNDYKILIDNSASADGVVIDKLFIKLLDGTYYGIDQFCIADASVTGPQYDYPSWNAGDYNSNCPSTTNSDHLYVKILCIDNEASDCGPGKVMMEFDINSPNQYISNALFIDGTDINVPPQTCTINPTSISVHNIGTKNYQQCKDYCQLLGDTLATKQQILDYLAGAVGGDVWTPFSDYFNGWLQIGGGGHPYSATHIDRTGSTPGWGSETNSYTFKKTFYCYDGTIPNVVGCVSSGESCANDYDCDSAFTTGNTPITNQECTGHQQANTVGNADVQSVCCQKTIDLASMECQQIYGSPTTDSDDAASQISCKDTLGSEWFLTSCNEYYETIVDAPEVDGHFALGNGVPANDICSVRNSGANGVTYPVAQCCRIAISPPPSTCMWIYLYFSFTRIFKVDLYSKHE